MKFLIDECLPPCLRTRHAKLAMLKALMSCIAACYLGKIIKSWNVSFPTIGHLSRIMRMTFDPDRVVPAEDLAMSAYPCTQDWFALISQTVRRTWISYIILKNS